MQLIGMKMEQSISAQSILYLELIQNLNISISLITVKSNQFCHQLFQNYTKF